MQKIMFKVALLTALIVAGSGVQAVEESQYVDLFRRMPIVLSVGRDNVTLLDQQFPLKYCSGDAAFICVTSDVLRFAIPKRDPIPKNWSYEGADYEIVRDGEVFLNGKIVSYQAIRQKWKGQVTEYAYSAGRGVIAIKSKDGGQLFLSTGCGFAVGARQDC